MQLLPFFATINYYLFFGSFDWYETWRIILAVLGRKAGWCQSSEGGSVDTADQLISWPGSCLISSLQTTWQEVEYSRPSFSKLNTFLFIQPRIFRFGVSFLQESSLCSCVCERLFAYLTKIWAIQCVGKWVNVAKVWSLKTPPLSNPTQHSADSKLYTVIFTISFVRPRYNSSRWVLHYGLLWRSQTKLPINPDQNQGPEMWPDQVRTLLSPSLWRGVETNWEDEASAGECLQLRPQMSAPPNSNSTGSCSCFPFTLRLISLKRDFIRILSFALWWVSCIYKLHL